MPKVVCVHEINKLPLLNNRDVQFNDFSAYFVKSNVQANLGDDNWIQIRSSIASLGFPLIESLSNWGKTYGTIFSAVSFFKLVSW